MAAEEKALAVIDAEYREYVPAVVVTPEEVKRNIQRLERVIKEVMREGIDYQTLPGTDKPTLLKPGAERLLQFFGFGHRVSLVDKVEDWQAGFFYYRYKVTIFKSHLLPDGTVYEQTIAECEGSCNSKEDRYRWRWMEEKDLPFGADKRKLKTKDARKWVFRSELPEGVDPDTLPQEQRESKKTGKPYTVYQIGTVMYRVENDDPYTLVNTYQKMAIKRPFVGATLQATGTSNMFTQDLEDMPEEYVAEKVANKPHATEGPAVANPAAPDAPEPIRENGEKHDQRFWNNYWQSWVNAGLASGKEEARKLAHELAGVESVSDWTTRDLNGLLRLAMENKKAKGQVA